MKYIAKNEIVPRNIAGVYFLVDISERDYYIKKKIFSTNETGYTQFLIMKELGSFSIEDILCRFITLLTDYEESMYGQIYKDTKAFVMSLIAAGYLKEA